MKKYTLITIVALLFSGCTTNPLTGKKELDPAIRNSLVETARSAVAALAAGYQNNGKFNWADFAQGALANVYSVDSKAAINKAVGYAIKDPGYNAAVTTALNTVINDAQKQGLNEKSAILTGAVLLDQVLQASKSSP